LASPLPSSAGAGAGDLLAPEPRRPARSLSALGAARAGLGRGVAVLYLSVFILLPLSAVVGKAGKGGLGDFWTAVSGKEAVAALKLTLLLSLAAVLINVVFGTMIAWVLVRDEFRGKGIVNSLIDLPFALPTIVAGLTLLALYGPRGPFGFSVAFTRTGILLALLFVTLPFVVRAVQPVLIELDREMEEAATSLGASSLTVFRSIILPNLTPAILSGVGLAFARCMGEFGAIVLISGNLPFKTELSSVYIFSQIESDNVHGAAAVSVVLLLVSFLLLLLVAAAERLRRRHEP
jgi:sulfate transport system permease protein